MISSRGLRVLLETTVLDGEVTGREPERLEERGGMFSFSSDWDGETKSIAEER